MDLSEYLTDLVCFGVLGCFLVSAGVVCFG